MANLGRPTNDPKDLRLTVRVAERDLVALTRLAQAQGVSLAEAARRVLRQALDIPALPRRTPLRRVTKTTGENP